MKIIIGMSGASGAIIGIKILENLSKEKTTLIISENAKEIIGFETYYSLEQVKNMAVETYDNSEIDVSIASGTNTFDAMVIAPCSTSTLSKIACGISDNLITRVAAISMKEKRKLIIVPRETPFSTITLKRMFELSHEGALILPPVPAFYLKPQTIEDIVNYVVGKVLEHLGVEHNLYQPYKP